MGSWRIEGYAGRGTYGLVYRARRAGVASSAPVALKIAVFAYDPRFLREAEILSQIHHPSVPQLFDRAWWVAGPEAAYPYLVMEWIRGLPLYEWAREHHATPRQGLRVLAQVASALDALHRAHCLHRDIKGDNILVEPDGRAVLTDYGSSTWAGAPPITESLMPPNTPEYRSPESLRFEWGNWRDKEARYQARPADDLYALGVTMYRLATRVYPPPGTEPEELKAQLQEIPPRRLPAQALHPQTGPEFSALIDQLLAAEPEARGQAREVEAAAEAAAALLGPEADVPLWAAERPAVEAAAEPARLTPARGPALATVEASVAVPVRVLPERRPHTWGWALGLVGFTLLGVMSTWWMLQGPREPWPALSQAEDTSAAEDVPDADTTGLGDGGLTAPVALEDVPASEEAISMDMPTKPLPGQRRAPCRRQREVEIHGGCWLRWPDLSPPCGDDAFEWKGLCYEPVLDRRRAPTARQPR